MRRLALALAATLLVSGCGSSTAVVNPADVPHPYPAGCADFKLSARRCDAILAWAVHESGADGRPLASVDLLGDPGCGGERDDPHILCKRTTSFGARVRLHFANGATAEQTLYCGVGSQYSLLCTETPEIQLGGPTFGGYWDTPGSTPPPILAAAQAGAHPLRVAALDVPIDRLGHYVIEAGHAVVPMGILTRAGVRLENPTTTAVSTTEEGVQFLVRSAVDGKPFNNLYEHGWHEGTEEVVATLSFDVTAFESGAKLEFRELIVE